MGVYGVKIGDTRLYGARHATKEETYNIKVRNVCGKSLYAVYLAGDMSQVSMYGIECYNGCKMLCDKRGAAGANENRTGNVTY